MSEENRKEMARQFHAGRIAALTPAPPVVAEDERPATRTVIVEEYVGDGCWNSTGQDE
jgi:hypothetical protein